MNPLVVENLKAGYGQTVILHDISFAMEKKEIRVILGGSGGGKSTLLNNIIGLESPMGGKVHILGTEVASHPEAFTDELRRKTGVLFQSSALISSMTVGENVSLPLKIQQPDLPPSVIEELVRYKLSLVQLDHAYYKYPGELSGGMKKRAALARAIITDPELLFCDEPSAGLDPISSKMLDDLLLKLRDKLELSLIMVTHELDSIRAIADKIIFLEKGYKIFDGSYDEALNESPKVVRDFFSRKANEQHTAHVAVPFNLEG